MYDNTKIIQYLSTFKSTKTLTAEHSFK